MKAHHSGGKGAGEKGKGKIILLFHIIIDQIEVLIQIKLLFLFS